MDDAGIALPAMDALLRRRLSRSDAGQIDILTTHSANNLQLPCSVFGGQVLLIGGGW